MQRKGSMQLSIEAIIILVIAMVLLGFGISFVSTLLNTGKDKLGETLVGVDVGCNTDASNPMTIAPASVELKTGESQTYTVCVYANADYSATDKKVGLTFECTDPSTTIHGSDVTPNFKTSPSKEMKRGQNAKMAISYTAPSIQGAVRTICTVKAVSGTGTSATTLATRDIPVVVSS